MRLLIPILSAILVLLCVPSQAQQMDQEEQKCCCSTYDTGQCLIGVHKKVDAELNAVYKEAMKRWSRPEDTARLRKAQRSWITYRDANCEAEHFSYEGGSMASNMFAFCQIRLSRQRIQEIKDIYLQEH